MMEAKWVVLLGPPGCGKGTQTASLVDENGFRAVVAGDIVRNSRDRVVQEYNKTIGELIDDGFLLPDKLIGSLIHDELSNDPDVAKKSILFDGYPRTIGQAEILKDLAKELGGKIQIVLNFVVEEKNMRDRILGRFKCKNCGRIYNDFSVKPAVGGKCDVCGCVEFERRADDNEASLKKRLDEYHEKTRPLVGYYEALGILRNVDASEKPSDVRKAVLKVLGEGC